MDCPACGKQLDPGLSHCSCGATNPLFQGHDAESPEQRLSRFDARLQNLSTQLEALSRQVGEARHELGALAAVIRPVARDREGDRIRSGPERASREVPAQRPEVAGPTVDRAQARPEPSQSLPLTDAKVATRIAPTAGPRRQPSTRTTTEWEAVIGGNWLLKVGITAISLGALYFLKYAFDNRWIGDTGRVLIGIFAGLVLLYLGERFQRSGYRLYGQTLSGGGIVVLYLSLYAASDFYSLIPRAVAFLCMVLVTAVCAALSARYASRTLAVLGILGGLLTPFLLSTGQNNQVGLLTYLLILDCGFGWLAGRQRWFFLNWISFLGTLILFLGWAATHYSRDALWLTEFYLLLFAALFAYLGWHAPRERAGNLEGKAMATLTVLLFFFSSQSVLAHNVWYYWLFLVLFSLLFLSISLRRRVNSVARGTLVLAIIGILFWVTDFYRVDDWMIVFVFSSVVSLLFMAQLVVRQRLVESPRDPADAHICLANGLGYFGLCYYVLSDEYGGWMGAFALLVAMVHLSGARLTMLVAGRPRVLLLAFVGVALTLLTLAVPIQLDQNWVTMAWAIEAAVLAWIGFETRLVHLRVAALFVFLLSLAGLLGIDAWRDLSSDLLLLNRRFGSFAVVIGASYLLAAVYRWRRDRREPWESALPLVLTMLANGLSVLCVSLENWFYHEHRAFDLRQALAREEVLKESYQPLLAAVRSGRLLTLSLLWGFYSIVSVVVGILRHYRPIRLFGIGLFSLTIIKVFVLDIWELRQFYRIVSVIGLGVLLLAVAFLYQRFKALILDR